MLRVLGAKYLLGRRLMCLSERRSIASCMSQKVPDVAARAQAPDRLIGMGPPGTIPRPWGDSQSTRRGLALREAPGPPMGLMGRVPFPFACQANSGSNSGSTSGSNAGSNSGSIQDHVQIPIHLVDHVHILQSRLS